jgi:hypothetical protein
METLIFILLAIACIVLLWFLLPYVIALPLGIIKAIYLIVSGHENDPEIVEMKEAKKREIAANKKARKESRKRFFGPLSFRYFFK